MDTAVPCVAVTPHNENNLCVRIGVDEVVGKYCGVEVCDGCAVAMTASNSSAVRGLEGADGLMLNLLSPWPGRPNS